MKVLNSGVDTLCWSARGDVASVLAELEPVQTAASERGEPEPWREIDGYLLSVGPYGEQGYATYLDCSEFRIHLGMQRKRPTLSTQLRASFIHTKKAPAAAAVSLGVARALSAVPLTTVRVSHVDPFADIGGWSLSQDELRGLVTAAKETTWHLVPRSEIVHSFSARKFPFECRMSDKRREIAKKCGFADAFWGDFTGPVTRVEFEIGSQRLRRFGVRSIEEVLASLGDLWGYGTSPFIQLRDVGDGPPDSWSPSAAWSVVQGVRFQFASSGVVPFQVVKGDRLTTLRALRGYLASFAAIEGVSTEAEALRRLGGSLPVVARGRLFSADVARKAARLPREYRQSRVA